MSTEDKLRLSYSGISSFLTCRQRFYWTYVEGLVPKSKSRPLQVGDIIHRLHHLWIINELTEERLDTLEEWVQELYPENTLESTNFIAEQARTLFKGYLEKYKDDNLNFISSEILCEVDAGPCVLIAKVDALARPDGKLWRVEHKTAARVDNAYLNGLKGGLQSAIYDYCIERLFSEPVTGTIYNMFVKTKVPSFPRAYTKSDRRAIEKMLVTIDGVVDDIKRGNYYPSLNCFSYNDECPYKVLCYFDSPETRLAFFNKKDNILSMSVNLADEERR